jgi:hypothetical protein
MIRYLRIRIFFRKGEFECLGISDGKIKDQQACDTVPLKGQSHEKVCEIMT